MFLPSPDLILGLPVFAFDATPPSQVLWFRFKRFFATRCSNLFFSLHLSFDHGVLASPILFPIPVVVKFVVTLELLFGPFVAEVYLPFFSFPQI